MLNNEKNPTSKITVTVTLENGKQIQLQNVECAFETLLQHLSENLPNESLKGVASAARDMLVENSPAHEAQTLKDAYNLLKAVEYFLIELNLDTVPPNDNV